MREWNLGRGDPLDLVIACDARNAPPDYADDQIWRLTLGGGEPPSLALETTFGLRARLMRLFPRFSEATLATCDPSSFSRPPRLRRIYPDYLAVDCSPFKGVDVQLEYRVPDSHLVTGRVTLTNRGTAPCQPSMEWVALLSPLGKGRPIDTVQMGITPTLQGSSGGLECVFFMTGGPEPVSSPFPALSVTSLLAPGASRTLTWAMAARPEAGAAFELARRVTARPWEAELARLDRLHDMEALEITTGDPDWDAAFALSQKAAFSLLMGPGAGLPHGSFVLSRQPDNGYSSRGDGTDYTHLWNGQAALDAYFLCSEVLPQHGDLARRLVENALSVQQEDGYIDIKPGLAKQRGRMLAPPCLASLALHAYELTQDRAFLKRCYPALQQFLKLWLSSTHDRDGDGFPEWDHVQQTGLEDHPLFDRWSTWGCGLDPTTVEDPALLAWLQRECQALAAMAGALGMPEDLRWLNACSQNLRRLAAECWNRATSTYRFRDRDAHTTAAGRSLGSRTGSGDIHVGKKMRSPARLVIRLKAASESTRGPWLVLEGRLADTAINEEIAARSILWIHQQAWITSQSVFTEVSRIRVHGLLPDDEVEVFTPDTRLDYLPMFLPLWAGLPRDAQANRMISEHLNHPARYLRPFGLPSIPTGDGDRARSVSIPWNAWIGHGLLRYRQRQAAAELFTRLMSGIILVLKQEACFRRTFDSESGDPRGEAGILTGLVPLGFFLSTLGIRIYSPGRILVADSNPFPWQVTVKYRGMTIVRQVDQTLLTFPDGQTISISAPGNYLITHPERGSPSEKGVT